jgi:hypothetical protein
MGMCISVTAFCFLTQQPKSQVSSQCSTLQKFRLLWLENSKLMQGTAETVKNPYNPAWRTILH